MQEQFLNSKLKFPLQGKTGSTNQQPELHYVHHALIAEMYDEEPLSFKDALAHNHWVEAMKSEIGPSTRTALGSYVIYLKVEKQLPPSGFTKSSVMRMEALIVLKQDL